MFKEQFREYAYWCWDMKGLDNHDWIQWEK